MTTDLADTPLQRPLVLPFTGQDLRRAVDASDIAALLDFAHQLRVAGYRVEPQRLASELLVHGCTWLVDSFGQRVPLQVRVPPRNQASVRPVVDESLTFRLSA